MVNRTPAGVPAGGEFAANAHDEAVPLAHSDRASVLLSIAPGYVGWVKTEDGYEQPNGARVVLDRSREVWTVDGDDEDYPSAFAAISDVEGKDARPVAPAPKDPTLEPRLVLAPTDELEPVPTGIHPLYKGAGYGIRYNEYWGDFRVETGYFGLQPQEGEVLPEHPIRWSSDQRTFEEAAVIWQHREDIDRALRDSGHRDRYRLRIEIDESGFTISEYDYGSFKDIYVPRRDV